MRAYLRPSLGSRALLFGGEAVPEAPQIVISASSKAEPGSINDVVGILSVAHSEDVFTFTITADPDSKFQIANDDELQLSATLNYETATSHNVTIEADNGVDDPITQVFTINVTDVVEPTANVVLWIGDSNLEAHPTTAGNLPANLETATDQYTWTGATFAAVDNAVNNNELSTPSSTKWGAEAEFGRQWNTNIGTPLYNVKLALSGTSLHVQWNQSTGDQWGDFETALVAAIADLEGDGFVVNIRAAIINLGANDAGNETQANAYETNLPIMFSAIRAYGSSSTRMIVNRIKATAQPYRDTVRAAQAAVVAADANAALVDTDSYGSPDIHYDRDAIITMGFDDFTAYNVAATVPDAFEVGDWSTDGVDEEIDVTISSLPDSGGSVILDVEYRLDGGSWVSSGGVVSFTITGLNNAQEYDVELRAVNVEGNGAASDVKAETPVGPTVPAAFSVGDWSIVAGDTEADVTISSLPSNGGSAITDIDYRLDGGSWVSTGGTTSFTITGLTNTTEYDVELRAVNAVGDGAASDVKQVTPVAGVADEILQENDDKLLLETTDPVELDTSIPAQSSASALTGDEWTVIVQGGTTKKIATLTVAEYING